jgi:hypothetical protein
MNSPTYQDKSAVSFDGNIWQVDSSYTCSLFDTTKFHFNVTYPAKCGATDKAISGFAAVGTVNASTTDLRITSGSPAIDFVPTTVSGGCPTTDRNGNKRPAGAACDAGASEYGAVAGPPAPTGLQVIVN